MTTEAVPRLIAIAGASCSGKSTLAEKLAEQLDRAVVLSMDRYYRDLSHLPMQERNGVNFDHPDALEHELIVGDLDALLAGNTIEAPRYDFHVHAREEVGEVIASQPYLILEGLYALHWRELRERAHRRVYIETDDSVCLDRRMRRDTVERGRSEASVRGQFEATVMPMYERFILPTRAHAEIVLDGGMPIDSLVAELADLLH